MLRFSRFITCVVFKYFSLVNISPPFIFEFFVLVDIPTVFYSSASFQVIYHKNILSASFQSIYQQCYIRVLRFILCITSFILECSVSVDIGIDSKLDTSIASVLLLHHHRLYSSASVHASVDVSPVL